MFILTFMYLYVNRWNILSITIILQMLTFGASLDIINIAKLNIVGIFPMGA